MSKRAIATPPGEETIYRDLTPTMKAQKDADEAAWEGARTDRLVKAVKRIAGDMITDEFPEWKQRNVMARSIEIVHINGAATPEDLAELDMLQGYWDWVKAVRAHSDLLEAQLLAAADPKSIDINAGWPPRYHYNYNNKGN